MVAGQAPTRRELMICCLFHSLLFLVCFKMFQAFRQKPSRCALDHKLSQCSFSPALQQKTPRTSSKSPKRSTEKTTKSNQPASASPLWLGHSKSFGQDCRLGQRRLLCRAHSIGPLSELQHGSKETPVWWLSSVFFPGWEVNQIF